MGRGEGADTPALLVESELARRDARGRAAFESSAGQTVGVGRCQYRLPK
jgi:hypothetical protein